MQYILDSQWVKAISLRKMTDWDRRIEANKRKYSDNPQSDLRDTPKDLANQN